MYVSDRGVTLKVVGLTSDSKWWDFQKSGRAIAQPAPPTPRSLYVCMYVCVCMYVYIYVCVCMYVCMCVYVCMYVCMHVN